MDKETESLWFPAGEESCTLPPPGIEGSGCGLVGVSGFYADRVITGLYTPAVTGWPNWKETHPDTKYVTD